MDFKQLEYFQTIYEEGSMSKAAEKLYISQQGLSKAVLALEKELDCKLFERTPKGVILTQPGEVLIRHTARILDDRACLMKEIMRFQEHESLSIDFAIGSRFSLPKGVFKGFLEKHPKLDLNIRELKNEVCIYNLEHGKTDIAIVIPPDKKEGFVYQPIKRETITVVMPEDHFLADREELSLSDLDQLPVVYHSGSISTTIMEQCKKMGVGFSEMIEVPGMLALYQICSNRGMLGISIGSLEGKLTFENLVVVPVCEEDVTWDITLMYHESLGRVKIVKEFVEYMNGKESN